LNGGVFYGLGLGVFTGDVDEMVGVLHWGPLLFMGWMSLKRGAAFGADGVCGGP
jgi:hypothetical protein